jgi:two-component system chemotaxis response regulator CheY
MKGRVLVVDDAAMIRSYLRQVLGEQGYEVAEAVNGCEGLEKALASTYDLIISDVNMPVLDGYSMVSSIRKEKSTMAVPIAMVSTEAHEKDSRKAYASGANFYLVKPVRPDELKSMVALLLGGSR